MNARVGPSRPRRGAVLVVVLALTALASMAAAGLIFRMRAEVSASAGHARGLQALAAADSGLQRAVTVLQQHAADPSFWQDNPAVFRRQLVWDDGADRWYFTIYAASPADPHGGRCGLTDEAAKINLNTADEATLLRLPNMTQELVNCLLDYRDADQDIRASGAEQEFYDRLPRPYRIPNGALASVEELLLVKGFTAALVYGEDWNLNGLLEGNEDDGRETEPRSDNSDGLLDGGLRAVACTLSYEPDVDSRGNPRLSINEAGPGELARANLPAKTVEFIRLYRQEGGSFNHPSDLLGMRYQLKQDHPDVHGLPAGEWIESGVGQEELPAAMDRLTAGKGTGRGRVKWLAGLVNVNTALPEVLGCLEGIDEDLARRIADARAALDAEARGNVAWLFTQNVVSAETFKLIAPRLTSRGYQYRVQCVGYGWPCGQYRAIEAVVDLAGRVPRTVYQRDLTRLGMPVALDAESLEAE